MPRHKTRNSTIPVSSIDQRSITKQMHGTPVTSFSLFVLMEMHGGGATTKQSLLHAVEGLHLRFYCVSSLNPSRPVPFGGQTT